MGAPGHGREKCSPVHSCYDKADASDSQQSALLNCCLNPGDVSVRRPVAHAPAGATGSNCSHAPRGLRFGARDSSLHLSAGRDGLRPSTEQPAAATFVTERLMTPPNSSSNRCGRTWCTTTTWPVSRRCCRRNAMEASPRHADPWPHAHPWVTAAEIHPRSTRTGRSSGETRRTGFLNGAPRPSTETSMMSPSA
jgi:hypothetical protein